VFDKVQRISTVIFSRKTSEVIQCQRLKQIVIGDAENWLNNGTGHFVPSLRWTRVILSCRRDLITFPCLYRFTISRDALKYCGRHSA